jgi:hypothetical protein
MSGLVEVELELLKLLELELLKDSSELMLWLRLSIRGDCVVALMLKLIGWESFAPT